MGINKSGFGSSFFVIICNNLSENTVGGSLNTFFILFELWNYWWNFPNQLSNVAWDQNCSTSKK